MLIWSDVAALPIRLSDLRFSSGLSVSKDFATGISSSRSASALFSKNAPEVKGSSVCSIKAARHDWRHDMIEEIDEAGKTIWEEEVELPVITKGYREIFTKTASMVALLGQNLSGMLRTTSDLKSSLLLGH